MELVDLTEKTFYEVVPYRRLRQLILLLSLNPFVYNGVSAPWSTSYYKLMRILQTFYRNGYLHGENLVVPIHYSKRSNAPKVDGRTIGRVYPVNDISCGCLPSILRGSLLGDCYVYLDISSSHSTILMALCAKNGIPCKYLSHYHNNRDSVIEMTMKEYNITREVAKVAYISCMNMSTYRNWKEKYNIEKEEIGFLHGLRIEMNNLIKQLKLCYPNYVESIKQTNRYKHEGVFESWLVQDFECMILSMICSSFPHLAEHAILNFDGIMVLRKNYREGDEKRISQMLEDYLKVKVQLKIDTLECLDLSPFEELYFEKDSRVLHKERFEQDIAYLRTLNAPQADALRNFNTFEGLVECFLRYGMSQEFQDYCTNRLVMKWCSDLQMEVLVNVTPKDVFKQIWTFLSSVSKTHYERSVSSTNCTSSLRCPNALPSSAFSTTSRFAPSILFTAISPNVYSQRPSPSLHSDTAPESCTSSPPPLGRRSPRSDRPRSSQPPSLADAPSPGGDVGSHTDRRSLDKRAAPRHCEKWHIRSHFGSKGTRVPAWRTGWNERTRR